MVSYRKFEQIVDSDDEEEEISTSTMKASPAPGRQPAPKPPPPKAPELPSSMSPSLKNAVLEAFAKLQQASARGDKKAEEKAKVDIQKLFKQMAPEQQAQLMQLIAGDAAAALASEGDSAPEAAARMRPGGGGVDSDSTASTWLRAHAVSSR